ncbi:MAG TPA: sugar transferase [Candidatus Udaeobacter sp.]|nr:sugar transferase [Candidatus Udaeobacter sp.]
MNGSAQKTRRWTKGGSLRQSKENVLAQTTLNNNGNGASSVVAPLLRNVVTEFFTAQRDGRDAVMPEQSESKAAEASAKRMRVKKDQTTTQNAAGQFPRWKRALDLGIIIATFPVWLPLMLLVMIVIKVGSRGPVFYRQERVGYQRKLFLIFKFRSMKVNAETQSHERHFATLIDDNSPMTKLDAAGDPRLVPLGRLLRATGLDELPQIFNVIRGDMSLVGPRPCLPYEFQRYETWQQDRVNAAPGLTGYWQVNGKNKTTFAEMIDMDIFYSKNMSWWLDLSIICKTIPAIIHQVSEARSRARTNINLAPSHCGRPIFHRESQPGSANL